MKKLPLILIVLAAFQIMGVAQSNHANRTSPSEGFLVDQSKPYVYLELDHVGPREQRNEDEPKEGIWLRLHNNCTVPVIVRTFGVPPNSPAGEIGVLDNVVANPPSDVGDGSVSYQRWPMEETPPNLATLLGGSPSKAPASPMPTQREQSGGMPHGYGFPTSSFTTISPGQSIYFSLPRNQVSSQWHVEIPFRFALKIHSPIRSAYNFVALFEEDVVAKAASSGLR